MDEWKPDFNKLKNYKIKESKFENIYFEMFADCIFSHKKRKDTVEEDINQCRFHLPFAYQVESGGDMRCSGKSEILHLMFPMLKHNVEFSMEEERGPISSKVGNFTEPDLKKLAIYVKRDPEEKLKCLLRYRSSFRDDMGRDPDYYDALPNELREESYNDTNHMRKIMLPSIYEHKNFIILENQNKEKDPVITNEKICKISKRQLERLKKDVERDIESDKRMIEKGLKEMIITRGKENCETSFRNAEQTLKYNKEYENICNTSKDISEIRKIMGERKKLRQ